jgi:ribosome-associated toxin RatA of RatAB toxin-antitoxin module
MRTVDSVTVRASLSLAFEVASDVERWPDFLPHYRWVKMISRNGSEGLVEMAAWRPFGVLKYPTWWVSEMTVIPSESRVLYKHVRGITKGMDVEWRLTENTDTVDITILHEWTGPNWPLIGKLAAGLVIGPVFIHGIASRTLAGVKTQTEQA